MIPHIYKKFKYFLRNIDKSIDNDTILCYYILAAINIKYPAIKKRRFTMDNQCSYITAPELAQVMGVSNGHAYKLIRAMNSELKKQGYLTIAGKLPRAYLEKCLYDFSLKTEGGVS